MKLKTVILIALGSLFLAACGLFFPSGTSPRGMDPSFGNWGSGYDSNGAQIYFTAANDKGEHIRYTGGPVGGGMMSGRLSCVSCHGEDGRGGQHMMHMQWMDAPDIRFETLSSAESEHQESGQEDAHEEAYDLETFSQAVTLGQHPDGEALSRDMPRWELSDNDLEDLFEFLKTLQ